jgi:hypothetical protein
MWEDLLHTSKVVGVAEATRSVEKSRNRAMSVKYLFGPIVSEVIDVENTDNGRGCVLLCALIYIHSR